jgi:hypothetical protein
MLNYLARRGKKARDAVTSKIGFVSELCVMPLNGIQQRGTGVAVLLIKKWSCCTLLQVFQVQIFSNVFYPQKKL